jgi:hypothetical protein
MLVNLSNHPSERWNNTQMNAAIQQYRNVKDITFPNILPTATTEEVQRMAKSYVHQIQILAQNETNQPFAVHVMGEMTFIYRIVLLLHRSNIKCIASTTERNTIENPDGSKTFLFNFVRFRAYFQLKNIR